MHASARPSAPPNWPSASPCSLQGDGAVRVDGVGTLAKAGAQQLAFLANPKYRSQLAESQAGVVVMREDDADGFAGTALLARDPYAAFAKMSALFEPRPLREPGVHAIGRHRRRPPASIRRPTSARSSASARAAASKPARSSVRAA